MTAADSHALPPRRHKQHPRSTYHIYDRRYFDRSRTWFDWNRLSISDLHSLRTEAGFEGQNVYFYLNHPIKFVKCVGVVVGIESVGAKGRFTLMALDDGSGKGITVKVARKDGNADGMEDGGVNTKVPSLSVGWEMGLPSLWVDGKVRVEVGTVLVVKGTLEVFRGVKQIDLERIAVVQSTAEEMRSWDGVVQWRNEVLKEPWVLSEEVQREVDDKIEEDLKRAEERARQKKEYKEAKLEKKRHHEKRKQARHLEYDGGALRGSDRIPAPWD